MKLLNELKYAESHEWVKVDGNKAYIGITDYAQDHLGEVVYVELPETGIIVEAGDQCIVLESVKAASDVYSPIGGTVVEINEDLVDNPGLINESAYDAWLIAVDMSDPTEINNLLSAEEYENMYH
ncbi:glycine cleavage system protein GcvH [Sedimentibacter hydroxybenzoicus DSM 7310]|uniref:Glycine cleavage system H protein n=1 Tax=Sedimentibacter hydroxybenzoicus DSM 7310 TaxID=1123245 RepID=A0A974BMP5_SEDHY|nr:glycine cleavage system protein GcvH [Sedimentibacter hydroxybenzoicus]NYB75778.1 glycine cleavage system protein GcvH [Sedimentibacter hydroxybenzoicus DSM 7310]